LPKSKRRSGKSPRQTRSLIHASIDLCIDSQA
jgi:hypothetical protein